MSQDESEPESELEQQRESECRTAVSESSQKSDYGVFGSAGAGLPEHSRHKR